MASTIKVDNVQNQPGTNIVSKCGTDVTIGASGDTVALASGASQTGFGRTGTVDWITTPKVTGDSPVTGVTGKGYFLNTAAGTITLNLPAGTAGDIVSMADYSVTWHTYNVTVTPNGSDKIGAINTSVTLNTEGQSVTLVYVDSTQGWLNTMDSTSNVRGSSYIVASGGNQPTASGCIVCTNYKIHKFTSPGTLNISVGYGDLSKLDYTVLAGGGGGGTRYGGGGGAGGYRESKSAPVSGCWSASPVATCVSLGPYSGPTCVAVTVGGGGAGSPTQASGGDSTNGTPGTVSTFDSITSAGGGGGASEQTPPVRDGTPGGSGGGGSYQASGGTGNIPATSPAQGTAGGCGGEPGGYGAGGGGGATVKGTDGTSSTTGAGGAGATNSIDATPTARAGGGGGAGTQDGIPTGASGWPPAGGGGGTGGPSPNGVATAGSPETGSGGGGGRGNPDTSPQTTPNGGGQGGGGIVIIRYRFQ